MNSNNNRLPAFIMLITTFVLWGSLYVVSSFVLGVLPTFTISWIRFLFAFLFLSLLTGKEKVKIEKSDFKYVILLGCAGYFVAVGAQLLGTKFAGSGMASLLNSLNPVTMTMFGALLYKEKLTVRKVAGILIAIIGVFLVLGGNTKANDMTGILFSLFAVLVWSFTSVFCRRVTGKYSPLSVTRLAIGIAVICYFPCMMYEMVSLQFEPARNLFTNVPCMLALLYMGCMCSGVAYVFWNKALLVLEASTCSAFYPVQPLVSIIMGVIFFGELITRNIVFGAVLIIVGVLLSVLRKKI